MLHKKNRNSVNENNLNCRHNRIYKNCALFVVAALFSFCGARLHAQVKEYIYLDGKLLAVEADGQSVFCTYSISPSNNSFSSGAGTGSIGITASNSGCVRTAVSNAGWVTITSGGSGTGNGTVNYSVPANSGPARSGTITVAEHTFAVFQSACSYSISPTFKSMPTGGGTDSVSVTCSSSNCGWTAASNTGWITITSGGSGTGNGTVNYSVAANSGPERSGTATIAGKTFTVGQAAGGCYSYCQTQYVGECTANYYAFCEGICQGNPGCIYGCIMSYAPEVSVVCTVEWCLENVCQ